MGVFPLEVGEDRIPRPLTALEKIRFFLGCGGMCTLVFGSSVAPTLNSLAVQRLGSWVSWGPHSRSRHRYTKHTLLPRAVGDRFRALW